MYDEIASNKRRTVLLTGIFVAFVFGAAWLIAQSMGFGSWALVIAAVISIGSSWLSYWKSDSVALAMSHAHPASQEEYARLHNLVEGLCIASGLPKPRLYVIQDPAPNAFATGRNPKHAAIAVTTGLLEKMNRLELEGVLAHELAHVKNRDILVSTLAVTMVGVLMILADLSMRFMWWGGPRHRDDQRDDNGSAGQIIAVLGILAMIFAPLVAKLMQFAVSRNRETLADVTGVSMTRYPPGLISALEKLRDDHTVVHSGSKATAHLWIESPIPRSAAESVNRGEGTKSAWFNRLFDTHPPLDERIAALKEL